MKKTFVLLTLAAMVAVPASATLIGDDVDVRWRFAPTGFDQIETVTVGAGEEINGWVTSPLNVDISDSMITVDFVSFFPGEFGLPSGTNWTFSDLDWVGTPGHIVAVTVSTNYSGWDSSFVTFGDDWIDINFASTGYVIFDSADDLFKITIEAAHDQTPIPEPMTLSLLGMGIAGLAARRRFLA